MPTPSLQRNAATADKLFDQVIDEVVLRLQSLEWDPFMFGIHIVQCNRDYTVEVLGPLGVFAPHPQTAATGIQGAAAGEPMIVRGRWEQIKVKVTSPVATTFVDDGDPETDEELPLATINVVDTTDFDAAGTLLITNDAGDSYYVTYTGKTPTSFTGAAGGEGIMVTGNTIEQVSSVAVRADLVLSAYQA